MDLFRRKPKPEEKVQTNPAPAEPLDTGHPVFMLTIGMDKKAVTGLLGDDYFSLDSGRLLSSLMGISAPVPGPGSGPAGQEFWLYSKNPPGHDIEIVMRSGRLASVEVRKRNADGTKTSLMRRDSGGATAAEPYQEALL